MTHPFAKMFEKALKQSSPAENRVLEEAEKIRRKGYSPDEILDALHYCRRGRIDDAEAAIIDEAIEEFEREGGD